MLTSFFRNLTNKLDTKNYNWWKFGFDVFKTTFSLAVVCGSIEIAYSLADTDQETQLLTESIAAITLNLTIAGLSISELITSHAKLFKGVVTHTLFSTIPPLLLEMLLITANAYPKQLCDIPESSNSEKNVRIIDPVKFYLPAAILQTYLSRLIKTIYQAEKDDYTPLLDQACCC